MNETYECALAIILKSRYKKSSKLAKWNFFQKYVKMDESKEITCDIEEGKKRRLIFSNEEDRLSHRREAVCEVNDSERRLVKEMLRFSLQNGYINQYIAS